MNIETFFDENTSTLTYIVWDENTRDALVIDPVMDYNPVGGQVQKFSYLKVKKFINEHQLKLHLVLETHAHADHLSASQLFKADFGAAVQVGISKQIVRVQQVFKTIFNLGESFVADGSQFDLLVEADQELSAGSIEIKAMHTPGHTPACMSYLIGDAVFTGDALFMPDFGTGRCDFPDGSATDLYCSISKVLYSLPDSTRVFVGHDYQPGGRELKYQSSIGEQKVKNIQLKSTTQEQDFIQFREQRDSGLSAPKLLFPSLQVNIEAGHLPPQEDNGKRYLKMPLITD